MIAIALEPEGPWKKANVQELPYHEEKSAPIFFSFLAPQVLPGRHDRQGTMRLDLGKSRKTCRAARGKRAILVSLLLCPRHFLANIIGKECS
jgi:hypothetical protein